MSVLFISKMAEPNMTQGRLSDDQNFKNLPTKHFDFSEIWKKTQKIIHKSAKKIVIALYIM